MSKIEIIISIKPPHVENILSGRKKYELRRRTLNVPTNTLIWIYSTLPSASFAATARLADMKVGTPKSLKYLAKAACISEGDFFKYYRGAEQACAIELADVKPIPSGADLKLIRNKIDNSFHPPQFFQKTSDKNPVTNFLRQHIQTAA